jgi:hypothetical protein
MTKFIPIVTIAAALSLLGSKALHGQDASSSADQFQTAKAQIETQKARDAVVKKLDEAAKQDEQASEPFQQASAKFQNNFRLTQLVNSAAANSGKTLIVRSSEHDAREQANLEEDLAVMARIFAKAIAGKPDDEQKIRTAMGIDVFFMSETSPLRNLYLDGYGALFMLDVNYPLLAPLAKTEEGKEKPPGDSAWQEARQELYGQSGDDDPVPYAGEAYSAEKVNNLKDALLQALKDGTNIRNLKPDDSITVCVFGCASARSGLLKQQARSRMGGQGEMTLVGRTMGQDGAAPHGTVMTIRVKKADVDAFAKGNLNPDEFRKKASIAIYAGEAGRR